MITQPLVSWLSDFLIFGVLIWLFFRVIRRKKRKSNNANTFGRTALSDESWWDQLKKWNPKGSKDD